MRRVISNCSVRHFLMTSCPPIDFECIRKFGKQEHHSLEPERLPRCTHHNGEFWDLDFVTDDRRTAEEREAGVGIQLLSGSGVEHYGITDLEWDPSGRYVASSASAWRHSVRTIPSTFQRRALSMFAHFRLKTALLFGIGAVLSWRSTSLINLNNSCGALDRVPFFRRKGRR